MSKIPEHYDPYWDLAGAFHGMKRTGAFDDISRATIRRVLDYLATVEIYVTTTPKQRGNGGAGAYIFDRYRGAMKLAEGVKVIATSLEEAVQKAKAIYQVYPTCADDRYVLRHNSSPTGEAPAKEKV